MNNNNIKRVSNLYAAYQLRNGFLGPVDLAAIKEFVQHGLEPRRLEMMQIKPSDFDKLIISERDGKPFKIRYKVQGGQFIVSPIVFEETGINGRRQVGFTNNTVKEVDDAEYKDLWAGKTGAASPGGGEQVTGTTPKG